jgi:hypothetical protein
VLAIPVLTATPAIGAAPDPVDIVKVSSTESTLEIVHGPAPDGVKRSLYKLDRAEGFWRRPKASYERDADGKWQRRDAYDAATRTWSDRQVELGHEYCYRVIVRNAAGEQSTGKMACGVFNGGDAAVRPPAPAADVEIVRSEPHLHVLSFTDAADNETGFAIERRTETRLDWAEVATLPPGDGTGKTLEFADDSVDMEHRYCYRVRAQGEHGDSLAGGACKRTPSLATTPSERSGRARPFVIERPEPRKLAVRWADGPNIGEWTVLLYDPDNLREPIKSTRVRDRRSSSQRLRGATFDDVRGNRLYCARVVRRNAMTIVQEHEILCESPHERRTSNTQVGPRADIVPRPTNLRPLADGLALTLEAPRNGQLVDLVSEHGIRFTYLDARNGRDQFHISGLQPETGYCVRPWIFNAYGSRYGEQLCATTLPAQDDTPPENSVTYSTGMSAQPTSEGVIPYAHVVEPGPPRPAQLLRVRVIGSSFSNFHVRFVRPATGPFSCSVDEGDGVTIVPGNALSGSGLATLFGSETPEIPQSGLALVGCKLLVGGGVGNTNPIPIDVTYRRP